MYGGNAIPIYKEAIGPFVITGRLEIQTGLGLSIAHPLDFLLSPTLLQCSYMTRTHCIDNSLSKQRGRVLHCSQTNTLCHHGLIYVKVWVSIMTSDYVYILGTFIINRYILSLLVLCLPEFRCFFYY